MDLSSLINALGNPQQDLQRDPMFMVGQGLAGAQQNPQAQMFDPMSKYDEIVAHYKTQGADDAIAQRMALQDVSRAPEVVDKKKFRQAALANALTGFGASAFNSAAVNNLQEDYAGRLTGLSEALMAGDNRNSVLEGKGILTPQLQSGLAVYDLQNKLQNNDLQNKLQAKVQEKALDSVFENYPSQALKMAGLGGVAETSPTSAPLALGGLTEKDNRQLALEAAKTTNNLELTSQNEVLNSLPEAEAAAQSKLNQLAQMEGLVTQMGSTGDFGENFLLGIARYVSDDKKALYDARQRFSQLSDQAALGQRVTNTGTMTDKDFVVYKNIVAGIDKTPTVNTLAINAEKAVVERELEKAKFLRSALSQGTPTFTAQQQWNQYINSNPLFDEMGNVRSTPSIGANTFQFGQQQPESFQMVQQPAQGQSGSLPDPLPGESREQYISRVKSGR